MRISSRPALATARDLTARGKTVKFYLVGRKGRALIARNFPGKIVGQFDTTNVRTPGFEEAQAIAHDVLARFAAGEFDVAHLFYAAFKSALVQIPTEQQIIPVAPQPVAAETGAHRSAVSENTPPDYAVAGYKAPVAAAMGGAVEYEPDEESILADLLPRNIAIQIFKALLENMASEQGASMTAMDNATRNAGDLIKALTIVYNRSRQAAITTELVEIISGAEGAVGVFGKRDQSPSASEPRDAMCRHDIAPFLERNDVKILSADEIDGAPGGFQIAVKARDGESAWEFEAILTAEPLMKGHATTISPAPVSGLASTAPRPLRSI